MFMKKPVFLLLLAFTALLSPAQQYDPLKMDKKAIAFFEEAQLKAEEGNDDQAMTLANKALDKEPKFLDVWLFIAAVHSNNKRHAESVTAYEKAFAIDSFFSFEYKLPYSINLAGMGKFDKALQAINTLLAAERLNPNTRKAGEFRKRCYEFAVEQSKTINKNYVFAPKNIGPTINSEESEYFPSLTIDNKELVFTRKVDYVNEDFFHSYQQSSGWEAAKPIEGDVNTPQNEGAMNISQDGQLLVFTACDRRDGYGSCDIYISYRSGNSWSEAINLGNRINTDQWESQPCLSPDKRDLYFASRRFGGHGGSDIYVSHLLPNGKWGEPENLGPTVNTSADEQCPFIHADNQTLYFTSNGLLGYGDADLYLVRKGPGGAWSKPENLGYPINTISQEGTLFIAADGKTAYYSSDRSEGKGGLDIYSFELREEVRPYKTLWVKGQVFDIKTKKGLPSAVELIELSARQPLSKVQTDEQGRYMITLPVGKDYAFNVNRKGYLFYSDNFSMTQHTPDSTYEKNIPLQPIEANASVVLRNVFFDVNKFDLKPESQVELDKVVQLLLDNPTLKIEISGHTDNEGKPADNLTLSINRSKAVVKYLTSKGVQVQRLIAKGYGETKPVADNKTEAGRAINRRTEMKVISQ